MKFSNIKYFLFSILISILIDNIYGKIKKIKNKLKQINYPPSISTITPVQPVVKVQQQPTIHFYASNAKEYVPFARLAYCKRPIIENFSCNFCNSFSTNNYQPFLVHNFSLEGNKNFQLVITYSDIKKEIVISFSGPSSEHGNFFTSIYLNGFVIVPEIGNLKVEKIYWDIYNQNFRGLLFEKVRKFLSFGRAEYKFIFVGHSFGGSLATLASYDLVYNRIIPKNPLINSPQIFTYGQLRIGDNSYIQKLNSELKIVRIIKKNDFIPQMPNCVYVESAYKCFDNRQALLNVMPRLKTYIDACGNPTTFFSFLEKKKKLSKKSNKKKDPIVRGTTMIGGNLVSTHKPIFYTQPLGTELFYSTPQFNNYQKCNYINGIPVCEKDLRLPNTFSPDVHRNYFNMNVELC